MARNSISRIAIAACVTLAVISCDKTPDYVIKPNDMVSLLVDIHKGEGVIDLNSSSYRSDSLRKVMRQSIYEKHGVTSEQVDTSLVYYGHNIEKYIEIYDKVIAELETELKDADVAAAGEKVQLAVIGDSVDAWSDSRYRRFAYGMPSDNMKFSFKRDENWESGDTYEWKVYVVNFQYPTKWTLSADYQDGTTDYVTSSITHDGWNTIKFYGDTAKTMRTFYGVLDHPSAKGSVMYVDSISLVRTRFSPDTYNRGMIKTYTNGKD
jgi:hypothetical protein